MDQEIQRPDVCGRGHEDVLPTKVQGANERHELPDTQREPERAARKHAKQRVANRQRRLIPTGRRDRSSDRTA